MKTMKRIIPILLTVLMLATVFSVAVSAESLTAVPDGYTGIYNIEDLYSVRSDLDGNYILMADIDLTEATAEGGDWDSGSGWSPIGSGSSDAFSGIFDGNGHTITGMRIKDSTDTYLGLFGYINGGTVKNLRMKNAVIEDTSVQRAGTITGFANKATIENIAVDNLTMDVKHSGSMYVGGIAGELNYSELTKSYVSGSIVSKCGSDYYNSLGAGGIVGNAFETSVKHCYNSATLSCTDTGSYSESYAGGIAGRSGTIKNCVNVGVITGIKYVYTGAINGIGGTLSQCYYKQGTASKGKYNTADTATTAVALTEAQMKLQVVFGNLDFENTWFLDTGSGINHPQLQSVPEVAAESISIAALPSKVSYLHYDELDISGLKISVKYEGVDTISTRTATEAMVSGYAPTVLGNQPLTVSFLGKTTTFDVYVLPRPVSSVTLSDDSLTLDIGKTKRITATVLPDNATDKTIVWKSDNEAVATVKNGLVTAVGKGTTTISSTSKNGVVAYCTVTVLVPADSVALNKSSLELIKGKSETLTSTVTPSNTTDTIVWSSSNSAVATVANGKVTAVSAGTATISVTTSRGKTASCVITVKVPSTNIILDKYSVTINVGKTDTVKATLAPADTTDTVKWTSSDNTVATVSSQGVITARARGTATITATTTSGKTATCKVTVLVPSQSVILNKTAVTLNKGQNATLTATMEPVNTTDSLVWKSSNTNVATVNNGVVSFVGVGSAKITVTTTSGKSATCNVICEIPATALKFTASSTNLEIGDTYEFKLSVTPTDSSDTIKWASSNTNVATVTSAGKVTAKASGTTKITATADSGATCSVTLTVKVHSHIYGDLVTVTESTCSKKGSAYKVCDKCGHKETVILVLNGTNHPSETYIKDASEATCVKAGYTGDTYCKHCNVKLETGRPIEKLAHTEIVVNGRETTCSAAGLTEGKKCSVCGTVTVAQQEIAQLSHIPGEWEVVAKSTIEEDGLKVKYCTVCNTEIERELIAAGTNADGKILSYLGDVNVDKKLTAADARAILRYSANLEKLKDSVIHLADVNGDGQISAADARLALRMSANLEPLFYYGEQYHTHNYVSKITKKATCLEKGEQTQTCSVCGDKIVTAIEKNAHSYKAATCTSPKTCSVCGKADGTALGHKYGNATCYDAAKCTVCGITTGSVAGHKFVNGTCSGCGLTTAKINEISHEFSIALEVYLMGGNIGTDALNSKDYVTYIGTLYASYVADGGLFKSTIDMCGDIPEFANAKAKLQSATNIVTNTYNSVKGSNGKIIANTTNVNKLIEAEVTAMVFVGDAIEEMTNILEKYGIS